MVKGKVLPALAVVGIACVLAVGAGTMLLVLGPMASFAAPADAASAVIDRWGAAYDANDAEALVKLYTVDAILHGTRSPILSERTEPIRAYFNSVRRPGDGAKVTFGEQRMVVLGDRAVLVTGFYEFTRPASSTPARFTMVIVKRGSDWFIVHHHSSERPK